MLMPMQKRALLLSLVICAWPAFANESLYTPLDLKKCKMIESSENDPKAEIDYFTAKCPGRDGYDIIISGGDLRSWIILQRQGKDIYDSRLDVFANAPGGFPYVAGGALEWRYGDDKKLRSLIFRIAGQDDSKDPTLNPKNVSKLLVIRHDSGKFCFVGSDVTNVGARKLADGTPACKPEK